MWHFPSKRGKKQNLLHVLLTGINYAVLTTWISIYAVLLMNFQLSGIHVVNCTVVATWHHYECSCKQHSELRRLDVEIHLLDLCWMACIQSERIPHRGGKWSHNAVMCLVAMFNITTNQITALWLWADYKHVVDPVMISPHSHGLHYIQLLLLAV